MEFGKRKDGQFYPKEGKGHGITSDLQNSEPDTEKIKFDKSELENNNKIDDLGLSVKNTNMWYHDNTDPEIRKIGNELIRKIVDMEKSQNSDLKDWKIHSNHIFNEYDTIQKTFVNSKDEIEELIRWRNDGNPKTWKWVSPIILDDGDEHGRFKVFDDQNHSWISDGYKGKVAITMMTPLEYLKLASPKTLIHGRQDIRGEEFSQKNVDELAEKMSHGTPIDTPYLIVDKNLDVFSHEGQHRALSAIKVGIEHIPVYVYMNGGSFTDTQLAQVSKNPTAHLNPDD